MCCCIWRKTPVRIHRWLWDVCEPINTTVDTEHEHNLPAPYHFYLTKFVILTEIQLGQPSLLEWHGTRPKHVRKVDYHRAVLHCLQNDSVTVHIQGSEREKCSVNYVYNVVKSATQPEGQHQLGQRITHRESYFMVPKSARKTGWWNRNLWHVLFNTPTPMKPALSPDIKLEFLYFKTWALYLHVWVCKWFKLSKSLGISPVDHFLSWQPWHVFNGYNVILLANSGCQST